MFLLDPETFEELLFDVSRLVPPGVALWRLGRQMPGRCLEVPVVVLGKPIQVATSPKKESELHIEESSQLGRTKLTEFELRKIRDKLWDVLHTSA